MTGTVLSVSAAVGFITLFGVAVMDGVLLVSTSGKPESAWERTLRKRSWMPYRNVYARCS
jgi:Cu/Ag efflux pump CusA